MMVDYANAAGAIGADPMAATMVKTRFLRFATRNQKAGGEQ